MVKIKPVSVKWQTIYAFLPYVSVWAFYRIQKLRLGLLLAFGLGIFSGLVTFVSGTGNLSQSGATGAVFIYVIIYVPTIVFTTMYIRKWSKQWNEQF